MLQNSQLAVRQQAAVAVRRFPDLTFLALAFLALTLVLFGCAARQEPGAPPSREAPRPESTPAAPAAPPLTSLQALAAVRTAELTPSLRTLFTPPQALAQPFFLTVSRTAQATPLAVQVLAHAVDGSALAVSREDGGIAIASPWPCHSLMLPGKARAVSLSLASQAGRLATLDEGNRTLRVFDLKACGEVALHALPSPVARMALSPDGQTLGYADAGYGLWAGPAVAPPGNEFKNIARLRFITLDVGFSPRGGLLVVVDQVGWITVWKLPEGQIIKTLRLPDGPFQEARIDGTLIRARTVQGKDISFDLTTGSTVSAQPPVLTLEEGVLTYTNAEARLHRSLTLGRSALQAVLHRAAGVVSLRDVDGQTRSYTLREGRPAPPPAGSGQPLSIDAQYTATADGTPLQLAFPLYKSAGMTLYCRTVEEARFLLWWDAGEHPAAPQTPPPGLPRMGNVFDPTPEGWIPLE